jgi:hypothetical protein
MLKLTKAQVTGRNSSYTTNEADESNEQSLGNKKAAFAAFFTAVLLRNQDVFWNTKKLQFMRDITSYYQNELANVISAIKRSISEYSQDRTA